MKHIYLKLMSVCQKKAADMKKYFFKNKTEIHLVTTEWLSTAGDGRDLNSTLGLCWFITSGGVNSSIKNGVQIVLS